MSQSVFQNIERVLARIDEIKRRFGAAGKSQDAGFGEVLRDEVDSNNKAASAEGMSSDVKSKDKSHNEIISAASERFSVPEPLIKAVIEQESGFREDAVSQKGALGLMQLMPDTASLLGVEDPFDAEQNIFGGTNYLRELIDLYGGNLNKALAAYNAGPSRVNDSIPDIPETEDYIRSVLERYNRFAKSKESGGL
jgi:soluble lytic murein transglycosylase-like protein